MLIKLTFDDCRDNVYPCKLLPKTILYKFKITYHVYKRDMQIVSKITSIVKIVSRTTSYVTKMESKPFVLKFDNKQSRE